MEQNTTTVVQGFGLGVRDVSDLKGYVRIGRYV